MTTYIQTPYGLKSEKFICRAMDAKEREPGLYKALADLVRVAQTQLDQSATERGLINCNLLAAARAALEKSKGWI